MSLVTHALRYRGICEPNFKGTTQFYNYDAADRLIGKGIEYDNFGRITSLPDKEAGGAYVETVARVWSSTIRKAC